MYDSLHKLTLDRCDWKGDRDGSLSLRYVEAWLYEGVCEFPYN